jgi:hypothetical protein
MKIKLIAICFISLSINSFAQEKYSLVGSVGLCDLRFIHPKDLLFPGDQYKTGISLKAGIYYDFLNSKMTRFYPTIGFSLTGKTAFNYLGINAFPPVGVSRDKFITLDLPIELNYQINTWLKIKGGINASTLIITKIQGPVDNQYFTCGYLLGLSMRYRQFSLNLEYIRDVNDMLKHAIVDNSSYRCSLFHVGIGYHFSSFKQFKRINR